MTHHDLLQKCRRIARRIDRTYARPDTGHVAKALDGDHPAHLALVHVNHMLDRDQPGDKRAMSDELRSEVVALWRDLDDLARLEVHLFFRLQEVLDAVLRGKPISPVPHCHVENLSRDCDGPHQHSYIRPLREPGHPDGEYGIRDFARDMIPISLGTIQIRVVEAHRPSDPDVEDYGGNLLEIDWSEPTDEGFSAYNLVGCLDPCDLGDRSQRDVFAEQMGY